MSDNSTLCPICGEGHLIEHTHDLASELEGHSYVINGLLHSLCDHCDEYITTPDQSRHNKRVIIAARDQAVAARDRAQRLTPAEILHIRKRLGLTQVQAARVFGGGPNAFGKYENGDVGPSEGMEKLLRLADKVPEAATWLLRRAGLPAPSHVPCSRENECPVLQRLFKDKCLATAELSMFRVSLKTTRHFTYNANEAANDSSAKTKLDMAAFG